MIRYVNEHRDDYGFEPICARSPIAYSTYHAFKRRSLWPRAMRDVELEGEIRLMFEANHRVYGSRGWRQTNREGEPGRDRGGSLHGGMPDDPHRSPRLGAEQGVSTPDQQ